MATCKKCGKVGLTWKSVFIGGQLKWRLFNQDGSQHKFSECQKTGGEEVAKSDDLLSALEEAEEIETKQVRYGPDGRRLTKHGYEQKPRGFWKKEEVKKIFQGFVDGDYSLGAVKDSLLVVLSEMGSKAGVTDGNVKWYISGYIRSLKTITLEKKGELLKLVDAADMKKAGAIKWGKFFNLDDNTTFDLRVLASMVYASERILVSDEKIIIGLGLQELREAADEYVVLWANRFAKYVLAACCGEWRHRRVVGTVDIGITHNHSAPREAMQTAAVLMWGKSIYLTDEARAKIKIALDYMEENFGDKTFFPSGGVGGHRWGKIAATLNKWVSRKIPDIVWVDYVWDIVHNGGCLFNKAQGMFQHEGAARQLLNNKRTSDRLKQNILDWTRKYLRDDFANGLEKIMDAEAGVKETKGWIGEKLGGQTLFGGEE